MKSDKLQDAIGLVKDELVDEAFETLDSEVEKEPTPSRELEEASEGSEKEASGFEKLVPPGYKGNSWVQLATNNERQQKIKNGKGFNSKHLQSISVVAACLILAIFVGLPWAQNHLGLGKNEEKLESAEEPASADSSGEADIETESAVAEEGEAVEEAVVSEETSGGEKPDSAADATNSFDSDMATEEAEAYEGSYIEEPGELANNGEAFVLTAGEWRDNDNWPFFTNLVTSEILTFPSFGIDPRNRIKVNVTDEAGAPLEGETVVLYDEYDKQMWTSKSNKNGVCYLFYNSENTPGYLICNNVDQALTVNTPSGADPQGASAVSINEDVTIKVSKSAPDKTGTQVMFIVDTTGSMADELAYLQMDFSSIAEETWDSNVWFSTNFYRDEGDEYITKTNDFTQNLATVQRELSDEYAAGGGDHPEAVASILSETITSNNGWKDDCNKVAFLIFDAPPHEGTEGAISSAVRSAAERGIHLVPVVASNADRETEIFGRALAIATDGSYVFLTDDSGVGESHLEPIIGEYSVELLHDIIVRIINDYK